MGLIKAAAGAGGGVLADQVERNIFTVMRINADVLAVKGRKKGHQAVEQH